jgi:hypothetical protein
MTGAFLSTRNTTADEEEALSFEFPAATNGIWEMRISAIDDDVTRFHVRGEQLNEVIDSRASLDEEDDLARFFEPRTQFGDLGTLNLRACVIGCDRCGKC